VSGRRNGAMLSGFVATFDVGGGELVSAHRSGRLRSEMLRELVDEVQARWPFAQLVCYSTPQTIAADLNGRQLPGQRLQYPEVKALATARRLGALSELLSLTSEKNRARSERRRAAT
jgi:hypothetical protein